MKIKTAVFPVAGFGTRMLPATKAIPKEMITLIDKPLIQYAVEEAINSGIERIVFITGRTKKALEDHFDISPELNYILEQSGNFEILADIKRISEMVDIVYVRQKYMLGLGNAIMCTKNIVGNEPFVVILPDDLIISNKEPVTLQLISAFEAVEAPVASIMRIPIEEARKYGMVHLSKEQTSNSRLYLLDDMVEKPMHNPPSDMAIIGRYVLTPEIFKAMEFIDKGHGGEMQLTDALAYVAKNGRMYGYEFEGKRFDCGKKEGLLEATINLAANDDTLRNVLKNVFSCLNI